MPHGYLKHAPKGEVSRHVMRGGSSGKSTGSSCRRRLKEIKLGGDGFKTGSRGHGGKGLIRRDLMHEVEWSKNCTNNDIYCDVHKRRPAQLPAAPLLPGTCVRFEAEPGVLVEGTIAKQVGADFTVEVVGGVRIPGVQREQLSLAPACAQKDSATTDNFVLVNAPLPRAESIGAPLPRMEFTDSAQKKANTEQPVVVGMPSTMVWATRTNSKDTPRPPPSFQALQAEDELRKSFEVVGHDPSPTGSASCHTTAEEQSRSVQPSTEQQPNPRVVTALQEMGFAAQVCADAALCTGNESVAKAARWLVEAIEQHEHTRLARPDSIGFVDKLNVAYTNARPEACAAAKEDEANAEDEDEWEVVSKSVQ